MPAVEPIWVRAARTVVFVGSRFCRPAMLNSVSIDACMLTPADAMVFIEPLLTSTDCAAASIVDIVPWPLPTLPRVFAMAQLAWQRTRSNSVPAPKVQLDVPTGAGGVLGTPVAASGAVVPFVPGEFDTLFLQPLRE